MWLPQLASVPMGWRFIAPDLPGFGATEPLAMSDGRARDSIDDYAADVIDLIDHLHLEEAVFAGVSMGGYVTLALFRQAARYVMGLILADTRATADSDDGRLARERMLELLGSEGPSGIRRQMLPKLLSEQTVRQRPALVNTIGGMIESAPAAALATAIRHMMTRPDSTPQLRQIHCPALVLVGEHDTITPVDESRSLARQIGGSRLTIIEGAGHLSNLEQPDAFNAAVAQFLTVSV